MKFEIQTPTASI